MSNEPVVPSQGWVFVHLFARPTPMVDAEAVVAATKELAAADHHLVPVSVIGHKADACFMVYGPDLKVIRRFQNALRAAGLEIVDSYISISEINEYATHLDDEGKRVRLYPEFPPAGKLAWCFYPMSKRRQGDTNWYTQPLEERDRMMRGHGVSGRKFAGRIVQMITASTGLDDWEWGVTLFGQHVDDLKDVVYTMRFDEASALYGEFGAFYTGYVCTADELAAELAQ